MSGGTLSSAHSSHWVWPGPQGQPASTSSRPELAYSLCFQPFKLNCISMWEGLTHGQRESHGQLNGIPDPFPCWLSPRKRICVTLWKKHRGRHLVLGLVREGRFRLRPSESFKGLCCSRGTGPCHRCRCGESTHHAPPLPLPPCGAQYVFLAYLSLMSSCSVVCVSACIQAGSHSASCSTQLGWLPPSAALTFPLRCSQGLCHCSWREWGPHDHI